MPPLLLEASIHASESLKLLIVIALLAFFSETAKSPLKMRLALGAWLNCLNDTRLLLQAGEISSITSQCQGFLSNPQHLLNWNEIFMLIMEALINEVHHQHDEWG